MNFEESIKLFHFIHRKQRRDVSIEFFKQEFPNCSLDVLWAATQAELAKHNDLEHYQAHYQNALECCGSVHHDPVKLALANPSLCYKVNQLNRAIAQLQLRVGKEEIQAVVDCGIELSRMVN